MSEKIVQLNYDRNLTASGDVTLHMPQFKRVLRDCHQRAIAPPGEPRGGGPH